MRRFILLAILAVVSMTVCAQGVETMEKRIIAPDEMKKLPEGTIWASNHMAMMIRGENAIIKMRCKEHVFGEDPFQLGFYDQSDSLRLFIKIWNAYPSKDGKTASFVANGFSDDSIPGANRVNSRIATYMIPTKAFIDYVTSHKGKIKVTTTTLEGKEYENVAMIKEE